MAAPMAIVIALGVAYARFGQIPAVQNGFAGLASAAAALVLATALKIAAPLRTRPTGIIVAIVTFAGVAALRISLPAVIAVMAPLSILLAWRASLPPTRRPRA